MKQKFRRNRSKNKRELVVSPTKGEALNPKQSAWLRANPHRTFLPFEFSYGNSAQDVTLFYDVDGLISLKTYLKKNVLDETALARLLVDLALSLIWCSRGDNRYFSMLFDKKSVFVDGTGHLFFVFVPFDGMAFSVENSPLVLLRQLSDTKHLKLEGQNARVLCERLAEYVLNENEVFSLNRFRGFIRSECWIDVGANGDVVKLSGSTVDTGIETSGYSDTPSVSALSSGQTDYEVSTAEKPRNSSKYQFVRVAQQESYPVAPNQIVFVGRGSDCHIRLLGNQQIGRKHLALRCTDDGLVLQDLASANGSTVAGQRLDPAIALLVPYETHFFVADEECFVRCLD